MTQILVIEDTQAIRDEIVSILELEGYFVHYANNGKDGIELALELAPDVVVCDIMMPDMDGYDVLQAVRKNPATNTTPFIFLTAKSTRGDMRYGMELGADDYITKPFTATELMNAITAQVRKRSKMEREFQERLNNLRVTLSRTLPHELRTPLVSVLAYGEMLVKNPGHFSESDLQDIGTTLLTSGNRLKHLIENYLVYTRLSLLMQDTMQLRMLRSESIAEPDKIIRDKALEIARHYDRDDDLVLKLQPARVHIIGEHLDKMITEMIDNAFKFSQQGTPVTVQAVARKHYIIGVHNYGQGMTDDEINAIDAFVQFNREKQEQQGTGLGLVIARLIAKLHGGMFRVISEPGETIEVAVALPIRREVS